MRKRIIIPIVICFICQLFPNIHSASTIVLPNTNSTQLTRLNNFPYNLKAREVEKILGRKLTFKERIGLTVLKLSRHFNRHGKGSESRKGETALILGIVGLVALLIPYLIIISIPCAIAALVLGYSAQKRNPENKKAKIAIILGWTTIALIVIAVVILVAVLSSWVWI